MSESSYERKQRQNLLRRSVISKKIINDATDKVASEVSKASIRNPENFNWSSNKPLERRVNSIIGEMNTKLEKNIKAGMVENWNMANSKYDEIMDQYLKNAAKTAGVQSAYYSWNIAALNSHIERRAGGYTLSKRVWNTGKGMKDQLDTFLGNGIASGMSANELARDVKGYLKEPDKRFHRVRNKNGKLVPSKNAKAYKPGRGVYRSASRNAQRLTRTEMNIAFRTADYERRKQLPFVKGIRVQLSGSHPVYDICDPMAGDYPKNFKFVGWHPNCFCYTTTILASEKDFLNYLETGQIKGAQVTGIPNKAAEYVKKNKSIFESYKSRPYWAKDNFTKGWNVNRNLTLAPPTPPVPGSVSLTKDYKAVESYWRDIYTGANANSVKAYERAMAMDSPDMKAFLKKNNLTKEEVLKSIHKTRKKLKKLKDTKSIYYNPKTGLYTKNRQKLHDEIVAKFLKGKPVAKGKADLLMTGGYPGSGKSSMLGTKKFSGWEKKYVHIDSDAIKDLLAQADGIEKVGWRAAAYHEEADSILKAIIQEAKSRNMNILFDGTMKNSNKMVKLVKEFKSLGYNTEVAFADLPMYKSMERAIFRYLGSSGRFVDPLYISVHNKLNRETYEILKEFVDNWSRYSTDVPYGVDAILKEFFGG